MPGRLKRLRVAICGEGIGGLKLALSRRDRPIRTHLEVVTKRIWGLLTSPWDQNPSSRPAMSDVVASIIQKLDDESMTDGNSEPGESAPAPRPTDEDDTSSNEETTFEETSLPSFRVQELKGRATQDDQYPFASGGNSNIYRGKLTRSDGNKIRVAIKVIRMSDDGPGQQEEMLRHLRREVDVWSRLKHKNILPFIGVCDDLAPFPVLVSPFYEFGHIGNYLSKHPMVNREELVLGVATGLQFLHTNNVVHGDLKVQNVLVDKCGIPCICDFGISKIVTRPGFTTSNVGTAPYMAPELFFVVDGLGTSQQETYSSSTSKSSDVYSFALLVLEILSAEPPKGRPTRPIVTTNILANLRPKRAEYDENEVSHKTWSVLERCWSFEPQLRPIVSEVLRDLVDSFAFRTSDM